MGVNVNQVASSIRASVLSYAETRRARRLWPKKVGPLLVLMDAVVDLAVTEARGRKAMLVPVCELVIWLTPVIDGIHNLGADNKYIQELLLEKIKHALARHRKANIARLSLQTFNQARTGANEIFGTPEFRNLVYRARPDLLGDFPLCPGDARQRLFEAKEQLAEMLARAVELSEEEKCELGEQMVASAVAALRRTTRETGRHQVAQAALKAAGPSKAADAGLPKTASEPEFGSESQATTSPNEGGDVTGGDVLHGAPEETQPGPLIVKDIKPRTSFTSADEDRTREGVRNADRDRRSKMKPATPVQAKGLTDRDPKELDFFS